MELWNRSHQHLSRLKELFLLLAYSSVNFAVDWMTRASMPFVYWGHILWPNKLKLLSRKKITSIILWSEIQDGSRPFFLNGMYYYVLFNVSYGWMNYNFLYQIKNNTNTLCINVWMNYDFLYQIKNTQLRSN